MAPLEKHTEAAFLATPGPNLPMYKLAPFLKF